MESDDDLAHAASYNRQHSALRSDLSAALAAFDRAQDWADLIHDLQRVNRVLNKHNNTAFLPDKHLLAKRLAQCLTSFLPSGVHLKALETYHIVFSRIGPTRLAVDLPLYAGGLFPLLSHCSTSLKGPLLSLYESHFLPLRTALAPVLDGLVLAILPGLDDETSEFYARSHTLLSNVASAVEDVGLFARSLWRALLLSPPVRYPAAHYLRSQLAEGDDDLRAHMVSDMPLVAYAITAALSDTDTLTQRNVLDLLLGELALDSPFFDVTRPPHCDAAIALVGGVFGTLLRRDISLTKRVHAWLLGGAEGDRALQFCERHSSHLVLAAVDAEMNTALRADGVLPTAAERDAKVSTRPCRVVVALMDRSELCDALGHHLALRMLNFGRQAIECAHVHAREISSATADVVHDIGSARVFEQLERMLVADKQTTHEDFELLSFSLSMFPTKDHIVREKHLPALLQVAVRSLNAVSVDAPILDKAVEFCSKAVLSMGLSKDTGVDNALCDDIKRTVSVFASFFVAWLAHAVKTAPPELRRAYDDVSVAEEYSAEVRMAAMWEEQKEVVRIAKSACAFFVTVAASGIGGRDIVCVALHATAKCASAADVRISLAGAKAFADVSVYAERGAFASAGDNDEQIMGVVRRCWRQMHPSLQTATAQSAQTLLALQRRYGDEVKVVIADGILSPILSRRLRNLERFACLWRLAVEHRLLPLPGDDSLFLMLDALTDEHWGPKMLARSWLSDALEVDAASVIDAPLRLLLTQEARTTGRGHEFAAVYDAPRALYAFQVLRSILESCPTVVSTTGEQNSMSSAGAAAPLPRKGTGRGKTGVRALAVAAPSPRTVQALAAIFAVEETSSLLVSGGQDGLSNGRSTEEGSVLLSNLLPAHNYVVSIALTCLGYLRGRVPNRFERKPEEVKRSHCVHEIGNGRDDLQSEDDEELEWILAGLGSKSMGELHEGVCAAAAECLATLLTAIPVPSQMSSVIANLFAEPVLNLISGSIGVADPVLQLHFLNAMTFLVTADGPCFLSSIQGKDAFTKARNGRRRISYSESQTHMQTFKRIEQSARRVQVSALESLDLFVPWLLKGVASACQGDGTRHDSGSQEVLGVRRRWIQFVDTTMKHVGVCQPIVTEGLLLILCELLQKTGAQVSSEIVGDSEFSRVDETLVLLEGLAVVTSNVLWSFEHALFGGELRDGSHTAEASAQSLDVPMHPMSSLPPKESKSSAAIEHASTRNSKLSHHVHSVSEAAPSSASSGLVERVNTVSNTTSAVINALNPLRMINDFVKDVLIGSGSDGTHRVPDPRRSGARVLFCLLPRIVSNVARVWGPSSDVYMESEMSDLPYNERGGPPRLSTELPRERRQAQRASVISILEALFELRPVDVIASVIAIFYNEQDEFGALSTSGEDESVAKMACHMLHAMDFATPDVVVTCAKTIFEKSTKWDSTTAEAVEGRGQAKSRRQALLSVRSIIESVSKSTAAIDMGAIGKSAANEHTSPMPGGSEGVDLYQPPYFGVGGSSPIGHQELFYWGDYFASYSPGLVEVACLNFLDQFLATCTDRDDTQGAWALLYPLLRDASSTVHRKAAIPAVLRVLGTFVSKSASPFPDRRIRREIMTTAALVISSCNSVAGGSSDISTEEHENAPLFRKKLAIVGLRSLSDAVPLLMDSAFLDDKPQLTTSTTSCLTSAVATLKKAASRAAAIYVASTSSKRSHPSTEDSTRHEEETVVDLKASEAAAMVLVNVSRREWGTKIARRDLLTLLEDANFFLGKDMDVLRQISAIIREVMAAGGASYLLSSLGTSSANATPGIPSLFIGRDSETLLRARAIRRIAYCVFVSESDFYSAQMPFVLEKVRDALRLTDSTIVGECLFCLRAILLRMGASSISAFRATILSEMFRILGNPEDNLNAKLSALRFLDLVTLLSPPDYGYERCFFFGESGIDEADSKALDGSESVDSPTTATEKRFVPLVARVSSLWTSVSRGIDDVFTHPLRLEAGRTVLVSLKADEVDAEIVGRYACGLMIRNSMPKMKAAVVDHATICNEFEAEFLHGPILK